MQTRKNQQLIQQNLVILAQGALKTLKRGFFFVPGLGDGSNGAAHTASSKKRRLQVPSSQGLRFGPTGISCLVQGFIK